HHRAAVEALQVRKRHLALAEALEMDLVLHLVEPIGETFSELALLDGHFQLALEPGGTRLGNLHLFCLIPATPDASAGQQPLLHAWMVRAEGLEPPWLAPLEPKSSASTNSATPAGSRCSTGLAAGPARGPTAKSDRIIALDSHRGELRAHIS